MPAAIEVRGISKHYRITPAGSQPAYRTLREELAELPGRFRHDRRRTRTLVALDAVSFEVEAGDVLGVIGRNGAGKTTLLKVLSRITRPTVGEAVIRGRVGSLLEVGTGFHPELTGRENIFLNGSILGMTRREVREKLEAIVDFAEVGPFLETPVKRYSSGMYVRLAFGVAAHLEPEILLIDEVLAVGDLAFQRKCLGKISDVARSGRTVLFVSHNMTAVSGLCSRVLLLEGGRLASDGPTREVINQYLKSTARAAGERRWARAEAPGNERVRLLAVRVVSEAGEASDLIDVSAPFRIETEFEKLDGEGRLNVSLHIDSLDGVCVFNAISPLDELEPGTYQSAVHVPGKLMNDGVYRVRVLLVVDLVAQVDEHDAIVFDVHDTAREIPWYGRWLGAVRPDLPWSLERLPDTGVSTRHHPSLTLP
ncbi:MAG TPA: polysaccharide ABC transporter ATP-binding protein [Planctomycetaceae bacterium]|nr:polysaccharide ABC transporter ATP-binding protein [Planctomycetaceae bacterium]